jgi:hypothetical protein
MQTDPSKADASYLYVAAGVVFFLSAWAASFSRSCQSDGCIGIVFPLGGALIALAVQVFVLIPVHRFRSKRADVPGAKVGTWIAASLAAFIVPLLFAKL